VGHEVEVHPAVICYSGYKYAERPLAFFYEEQRLEVDGVQSEWASPSGRGFKVLTRDGRCFKLYYDELGDQWQVSPA
jgi:hypothetical protein